MNAIDRRSALKSIGGAAAAAMCIAALPKSAAAAPLDLKNNVAAKEVGVCEPLQTTTLSARSRRVCWWRRGRRVCTWQRWTCWWSRGRRVCGWR